MSEYNEKSDKKNLSQILEAQDEINSDSRSSEYAAERDRSTRNLEIAEREFRLNAKKRLERLLLSWMVTLWAIFLLVITLGLNIIAFKNAIIVLDDQNKQYLVEILIVFCIFLTSNLFIVVTTFGAIILTNKAKSVDKSITSDTVKQAMEILKPFLDIIKSIRS
jgi:hypothetical protein